MVAFCAWLRQSCGFAHAAAVTEYRAKAVRGTARLRTRPARRIVGVCGRAIGDRRGLAKWGGRGG